MKWRSTMTVSLEDFKRFARGKISQRKEINKEIIQNRPTDSVFPSL